MAGVLVTEAQLRHSLAVIRSLGRRGIYVAAADKTRFSTGFFSKYCKRRVVYTDPEKNEKKFIREMLDEVKAHNYDVFMCLTHDIIFHISKHRKEFEKYTRIPVVEHKKLVRANNKKKILLLAQKLGIPVPKTRFVKSTADVEKLKDKLEYPIIIKPVNSTGSRGLALVKSSSELARKFAESERQFGECMLQEYIPPGGDALGVSLLFDYKSRPKAVFTHKRLREYPQSGGPSVLRESVSFPEIEKYSVKLLRALKWFGIAMVEYKIDPRDNKPKLMEINPRLWGSLALAIHSGVDFPYLLYRLVMDGDVKKVSGYKLGVKCRWLLPGDIFYLLSVKNKLKFLPEFLKFRGENLYYDIIARDDMLPVLGVLLAMARYLFDRNMWRYAFRKNQQ